VWVTQHGGEGIDHRAGAAWLFAATMALLLAPKALAGALILGRETTRRGYGGAAELCAGQAVEVVRPALGAPVMMLMPTLAVFDILMGRDAGWSTQQRDPGRMSRADAWRTHGGHVLIGAGAAGLACLLDTAMFWWACPVYLGLVLSAPLTLLLAQPALGRL